MLTTVQSKLVKLAEEATEVGKEALKMVHYGQGSIYEGKTVEERLRDELLDLLLVVNGLQQLGAVRPISFQDLQSHYNAKYPKISVHTQLLHQRGSIESAWIPESP